MSRDPLVSLGTLRRELLAIKSRDYAAALHHPWPAQTHSVLSLATGEPVAILSRDDFNARQRRFYLGHEARPRYDMVRRRAMRPTLGQLRMIEAAIGCDLAGRAALQAWQRAAA